MAGRSIRIAAPAKINLYLGVHTEKDERGYHKVDSVMAAVDLFDIVTLVPASELSLAMEPAADFPMQNNTAYKAAVALGRAFGREPAFAITIEKHIPMQAGLGGPSTDAAAVIRGICDAWGIDPLDVRVLELARSIGADVPFFLYGRPAYLVGAGDELCELFSPFGEVPVALVKPSHASVSTPAAYRRFDEAPIACEPLAPLLEALRAKDSPEAFRHTFNNLAPVAEEEAPEISAVLAWLREQPGVRALDVCGSGACCYAVCSTKEAAEKLAERAEAKAWWSCATALSADPFK